MAFFDVLAPNIDLLQNRFLEASAGTGKTFAIEKLILRLLTEKEEIEIEDILAITFTKEAALEMKQRVFAALKASDSFLAKKALAKFEKIQIFTIHGFCLRMLQEYGDQREGTVEMAPFEKEEAPFQQGFRAMKEVVFDLMAHQRDPMLSFQIALLLKASRYDLETLMNKVVEAMHPSLLELSQETNHFVSFFKNIGSISKELFIEDCLRLQERYKRMKVSKQELIRFATFLHTQDLFILLEEKRWFFEKMEEANVKNEAKPLSSYSLHYPFLFLQGPSLFKKAFSEFTDLEKGIKQIACLCYKAWEKKGETRFLLTFDTLLLHMEKALASSSFVEKIANRYQMVIVDEFQDTDPVQWNIIAGLFLHKKPLYLVGDPKQSIYSFRRADLRVYFQAKEALGEEYAHCLRTNYRSSPALIRCLNALFTKYPKETGPAYVPVEAGRTEGRLKGSVFHCPLFKQQASREKSFPSKKMEEEELFPYIASEVIRLQKEEGVSLEEIAILIKDRFQAERLKSHLEKKEISAQIRRTTSLTSTRGFWAIAELLAALGNPHHKGYEAMLRNSPLCLSDIGDIPTSGLSAHLRAIFLAKGFPLFMKECLEIYFSPPPSLYLECRHVMEALLETEDWSLEGLLMKIDKWIEEQGTLSSLEKPEQKEKEALSILTIFASKGLEFEVVFSLATACRHFAEEEEKEEEKLRQFYVALTRAKERIYLPFIFEEEGKERKISSAQELFFSKGWKVPLWEEWEEMGLTYEWVEKKKEKPPSLEGKKEETLSLTMPFPLALTPIKNGNPLWVYSFSSLSHVEREKKGNSKERRREEEEEKKTPHTLPKGKQTGIILHSILEKITSEEPGFEYKKTIEKKTKGTFLQGWEEVILEMVSWAVKVPLAEGYCLEQIDRKEKKQEMEFLFSEKEKGRYVKGVIDLLFFCQGKIYLLDWKTNWLGDTETAYTEEKIEEEMRQQEYFLQAFLYQEALFRYLRGFGLSTEKDFGGIFYLFLRGKKAVKLPMDFFNRKKPLPFLIPPSNPFEIRDPSGGMDG